MSDTLVIGGTTFNDVAGFKATDSNSNTKTYIRPDGTININQNGTIDVSAYATAVVNVEGVAIVEVTISDNGSVSQALDPGKIYHFTGTLTALTITLNAATTGQLAQYHFDFDCGSTAPTVTIPNTVIMPDGNSFDLSMHYEVDILNNYGVVSSWTIS